MPEFDDLTRSRERFLAELEELSDAAIARMATAYSAIARRLVVEFEKQYAAIQKEAGTSPDRARRLARTRTLLDQVEREIRIFADIVRRETDELTGAGIAAGTESAREQVDTLLAPGRAFNVDLRFDVLPVDAIRQAVAVLGEGSPLYALLDKMGPEVRQQWQAAIVAAIANGDNPRKVGRDLAGITTGGIIRATRIARTEMLRAYRQAHIENYRANSNVVKGWMWMATFSPRTCAACLSKHGQIFPLTETLDDHPNGRCSPAPVTKTWAELGIPGAAAETSLAAANIESGDSWLGRQDVATQRQILGARGANEFRAGNVKLADFAAVRSSKVWGKSIYALGVDQALANARKRGGGGSAPPTSPAPRPPTPAPAPARGGTPVSNALRFDDRPALKSARRAAELIDSVHTDGVLPQIPVKIARLRQGVEGRYRMSQGQPVDIEFRAKGGTPLFTAAHELGHFIDHVGIDPRVKFPSLGASAVLDPWMQAVKNSSAFKTLRDYRANPLANVDGKLIAISPGYITYALDPRELFARSYSQYIAIRSGDAAMLAELSRERAGGDAPIYLPMQWEDDDFAPIAKAFDEVFSKLGWR
jgi:SPP1 gp7 family putative phage head morphogenesis protein